MWCILYIIMIYYVCGLGVCAILEAYNNKLNKL